MYVCIHIYIYIYVAVERGPCGAWLQPDFEELLRRCTIDFRNFIVFFWAETLAHWNPTSCQQTHPQLICSDLRLSNWKFEDWNYGNRPYRKRELRRSWDTSTLNVIDDHIIITTIIIIIIIIIIITTIILLLLFVLFS